MTPPEVNNLLRDNGGYSNGCLVNSDRAAELLGIEYNGKTTDYQTSVCIAETGDWGGQHFFVWLGNGHIIDPLIGYETTNNYNIKSFRLFKPKGGNMNERDWARGISAARSFQVDDHEVDYILGYVANGGKPEDYSRSNLFNDAWVNNLWIATMGVPAPQAEKDFWHQFGIDHPGNTPEQLAYQWFKDHIIPIIKARDEALKKVKDLTTSNNQLSSQVKDLGEKLEARITESDNATNDAVEALGDLETHIEEVVYQQSQTLGQFDVRKLGVVDLLIWIGKKIMRKE